MDIDVAFCVNDIYADYIGVTIKSICENNQSSIVNIHVLTDFISYKRRETLIKIVAQYPFARIMFYEVDDSRLRGLKDTWSIYTWYRVLLPEVLSNNIQRVLYLDADTLVLGDLLPLFEMDMTDHSIGCSIDVETINPSTRTRCGLVDGDIYVCAGIMLMNLEYWRNHDLSTKIVEWGYANDKIIKFPDQDTINVLCRDNKIVLPIKFGIQEIFYRNAHFYENHTGELVDSINDPVIVHFAGCAPWIMEFSNHMYHSQWLRYSRMLSKPIYPKYSTKGFNKIKVILWRWLNKRKIKAMYMTKDRVLSRIHQ